jgi:hypothetical protein
MMGIISLMTAAALVAKLMLDLHAQEELRQVMTFAPRFVEMEE